MIKLQPKEKRILDVLKAAKGEIVPSKIIMLQVEDNPVKRTLIKNCWGSDEVKREYGALKVWIFQIKEKTGLHIQNIKNVGYRLL